MAPRQLYVLYTLAFAFCISAWKPQQFLGEFLDSRISDPHQRSSLVHALFESAEHVCHDFVLVDSHTDIYPSKHSVMTFSCSSTVVIGPATGSITKLAAFL